jgi:hypothetical protein
MSSTGLPFDGIRPTRPPILEKILELANLIQRNKESAAAAEAETAAAEAEMARLCGIPQPATQPTTAAGPAPTTAAAAPTTAASQPAAPQLTGFAEAAARRTPQVSSVAVTDVDPNTATSDADLFRKFHTEFSSRGVRVTLSECGRYVVFEFGTLNRKRFLTRWINVTGIKVARHASNPNACTVARHLLERVIVQFCNKGRALTELELVNATTFWAADCWAYGDDDEPESMFLPLELAEYFGVVNFDRNPYTKGRKQALKKNTNGDIQVALGLLDSLRTIAEIKKWQSRPTICPNTSGGGGGGAAVTTQQITFTAVKDVLARRITHALIPPGAPGYNAAHSASFRRFLEENGLAASVPKPGAATVCTVPGTSHPFNSASELEAALRRLVNLPAVPEKSTSAADAYQAQQKAKNTKNPIGAIPDGANFDSDDTDADSDDADAGSEDAGDKSKGAEAESAGGGSKEDDDDSDEPDREGEHTVDGIRVVGFRHNFSDTVKGLIDTIARDDEGGMAKALNAIGEKYCVYININGAYCLKQGDVHTDERTRKIGMEIIAAVNELAMKLALGKQ